MQTSLPTLEKATYEGENRPTLNVVIVYEDFAAGKHAQETYDFLVNQLGQDFDFSNQMWKFDVLDIPKMRELAVRDTAASDLVLVSTHGAGELPDGAKCWLNEWAGNKGNTKALVALVDRPADLFGEVTSIRSCLQEAARRAGVDFFGQPDELPALEEDFSVQQISERAQQTSALLTDFIHQSADDTHWGINE
jgi:hypothetical protein